MISSRVSIGVLLLDTPCVAYSLEWSPENSVLVSRHKASHTSRFLCGVKRLPIASLDGPSRAPWGTIGTYEAGDFRLKYSVIGDVMRLGPYEGGSAL
jgi:hypothetical protein